MNKLKLAYFGTPDFSAYFLEKILLDKELPVEVTLVVTQEDKPVGRKQILTSSPVKKVAEKFNIAVETKPDEALKNGVDLAVLFAYGEIISKAALSVPKYGFWNIHPSLLPKYRGASPVASALITGDNETGATLIKMDSELDHGPIIAQETLKIQPKERREELTLRLAEVAYDLLKKSIILLTSSRVNQLKLQLQDDKKATFTKRFEKKDGFISIENLKFKIDNSPKELFNLFRGLYPWPGIWSKVKIKNKELRIKITDMDLVDGKLIIKKVQLEGKKEVDFETFNREYKVF